MAINNADSSISTTPNPNPNPSLPQKPLPKRFTKTLIPFSLLSNPSLNSAISLLPSNYDFDIHKTIHRINSSSSSSPRIILQFPDGLLLFSLPLADILLSFSSASSVLILAEPTYGACCLDDHAASALSADLLIHYGHSCLVPLPSSLLPVLYNFVAIHIDVPRLVRAVKSSLASVTRIALAGTVQFSNAVHAAKPLLETEGFHVVIPQAKPLSAGEVLGCTAPRCGGDVEAVVFVADGRFHLEAFMIANPGIRAYRYDPYVGVLVLEEYDHEGMRKARKDAIRIARGARNWGIVLGTLGRQGNTRVLDRVVERMEEKGLEWTVVLMSELSPGRIALFGDSVDAWVQIACPRLSIDWGEGFGKPMLTTFELEIALGYVPGWWEKRERRGGGRDGKECEGEGCCRKSDSGCGCGDEGGDYPMDYYAQDGGDWNSSYAKRKTVGREVKHCN